MWFWRILQTILVLFCFCSPRNLSSIISVLLEKSYAPVLMSLDKELPFLGWTLGKTHLNWPFYLPWKNEWVICLIEEWQKSDIQFYTDLYKERLRCWSSWLPCDYPLSFCISLARNTNSALLHKLSLTVGSWKEVSHFKSEGRVLGNLTVATDPSYISHASLVGHKQNIDLHLLKSLVLYF